MRNYRSLPPVPLLFVSPGKSQRYAVESLSRLTSSPRREEHASVAPFDRIFFLVLLFLSPVLRDPLAARQASTIPLISPGASQRA